MTVHLSDLLVGSPAEITLTEETVVLSPLTIPHALKINGDGKKLTVREQVTANGELEIEGADLSFIKGNVSASVRAFVLKAGFSFRSNTITLDVTRAAGSNLYASTPAWLIEANQSASCGPGILSYNTITGTAIYGCGLVIGTDMSGFEAFEADDNDIRYIHGGFILNDISDATLGNNRLDRVSFSNFAMGRFGTLLLEGNDTLISGGGASGDSITLGSGSKATIRKHSAFGGSCYHLWASPSGGLPLDHLIVEDSYLIGGGTAAIRCTGESSTQRIGKAEFRRTVMGFHSGRGWEGRNIADFRMTDCWFGHNNFTDADDGSQIAFINGSGLPTTATAANVNVVEYARNRKLNRYVASYYPIADNKVPYVSI